MISPSQQAPKQVVSAFWDKEGMDSFVDWITNPNNHARLSNPSQRHYVHTEIARYINTKHGTNWNSTKVRHKIVYARKKFDRAAQLSEQGLRDEMLAACPSYEKFHVIWGDTHGENLLPPEDSLKGKDKQRDHQEPPPEPIFGEDDDEYSIADDNDAHYGM